MDIEYAVIAKYADVSQDGLVTIVGGGVDALLSPSLPFQCPLLAVAVGLRVQPDECEKPHAVQFEVIDPSGDRLLQPPKIMLAPKGSNAGPKAVIASCTLSIANFIFAKPGDHQIRVFVDDQLLRCVELRIAQDKQSENHEPVEG